MKKIILWLIIFLVIGAASFAGYQLFFKKKAVTKEQKTIGPKRELLNQLALEKRPYITLFPREDGRELTLTITNLKNGEEKVTYELEYQAGNLLQSATGKIDIKQESAPLTRKILLGSCSAGGKCSYDENVSSGSLFLFFKGKENYNLKGDFTFHKISEAEGVFTSRDAQITLETGKNDLQNVKFLLVVSTMGLPGEVEGKVISGPVGFFTANTSTLKDATLTFQSKDDLTQAKILGWDGEEWQAVTGSVKEDTYSSEVSSLGTFVLASD